MLTCPGEQQKGGQHCVIHKRFSLDMPTSFYLVEGIIFGNQSNARHKGDQHCVIH
jgi:hypothetical protein